MASMQTDVKSKYISSTGASGVGLPRARVKGIYYVAGALAGVVSFKDGGSSGTELIKLDTPTAASSGTGMVIIPGEGVLFTADPYVTLTNVVSVTFFYG